MSKRGAGAAAPIMLLAILAVGMVGGAAALWWERLFIDVTVNTGTLDAELSVHGSGDNEIELATAMGEVNPAVKDVSNITCTLSEDRKSIDVIVNNAYPSITYWCIIDLKNTGTIPFKVYNVSITGNLTTVADVIDFYPGSDEILHIVNGTQLEPGDEVIDVLKIHLTNDAQENTVYTAKIVIEVEQWNEYPTPLP